MLSPWISYGAFVAVTLGMLALAASMLSYHARSHLSKWLIWFIFFLSPLTYWLLFVGNVHGLVVLSASFVLVGLFELEHTGRVCALGLSPQAKVGAGLLISLLSKPVLVFLIPGLLLLRATRRATILAVTAYAVASIAFIVTPSLNPESVGTSRLMGLLSSPTWVKANLNIYTNDFTVTRDMRDNAMHWLHMVAQSTYTWDHAQVFSLPVLLKGLTGKAYSLESVVFLPALAAVVLPQIRSMRDKLQYLTWLLVLSLSLHFAAYSISWEYQYTQLLVVSAGCLSVINIGWLPRTLSMILAVALLTLQLPSPYVLVSANGLSADDLILMRVFRLSPAIASAMAAVWTILSICRTATRPKTASLPTTGADATNEQVS
jgi:hypothetical protein